MRSRRPWRASRKPSTRCSLRGSRNRTISVSLRDELHIGDVPADELITTLGGHFSLARWEAGRVVEYFSSSGEVALRVIYEKHGYGLTDIEAGPGLSRRDLAA